MQTLLCLKINYFFVNVEQLYYLHCLLRIIAFLEKKETINHHNTRQNSFRSVKNVFGGCMKKQKRKKLKTHLSPT